MSEATTGAGSKVVSDKWVDLLFKLMHERDAARAEVARLRAAIDDWLTTEDPDQANTALRKAIEEET